MNNTLKETEKQRVENQFDSYCKKVIISELRNEQIKQCKERERLLYDEFILDNIIYNEEKYEDLNTLDFFGDHFVINNDLLYQLLTELTEEEIIIIIYSYFYEMSDQEIANRMNCVRRTINYKRNKILKSLRERKLPIGGICI